ncbi:hypothetical protein Taro_015070 [Colocasia esculenta]|uniref:DNA-binding protein S1FA n=1 Tax=Colocasia esculenta TaxID=4460 RepID=A0A843UGK6_COLES|nr:hypothetical protein [Colocasia esculenta]
MRRGAANSGACRRSQWDCRALAGDGGNGGAALVGRWLAKGKRVVVDGERGNVIREEVAKGLNPGLIVLLVVVGLLLVFFVGNYALYTYAQKTLPPRKKKPISKKKMKKERLKQGVSAPGE